ncbi:unnamed protein product, partial [Ectocarpus fasciculatus]
QHLTNPAGHTRCGSRSKMGGLYKRRRGVLSNESARAPRRSAAVALVLLLCQARGLVVAPACFQHSNAAGGSSTQQHRHTAAPLIHAHASRIRPGSTGAVGGFRRGQQRVKRRSRLEMANPEGTQQLRDRDLEFMFYDEAQVYVRGGSGGEGAASFKVMAKKQRGQPNGGSGGKGGDVTLVCESSLNTLVNLRGKMSFVAEKGTAGQQRLTNGKDGGSIEIPVPPGTVVKDRDNGGVVLGELREGGERLVVAKGGYGGRGNAATKVQYG